MEKLYTLFFLLLGCYSLVHAGIYQGYIITHNNRILTGQIGTIYSGNQTSAVIFINDFGTPYNLRAELIKGFVYHNGEETFLFESKYNKQGWMFLRVVCKGEGEGLNLYQAPAEETSLSIDNWGYLRSETLHTEEYWIEQNGKFPVRITRLGFKKKLRRLIRKQTPELAQKIGSPGFRFNDLEKIIQEYNNEVRKKRYRL